MGFSVFLTGKEGWVHVFHLQDFEGEKNEDYVRTKGDCKDHRLEQTKGDSILHNTCVNCSQYLYFQLLKKLTRAMIVQSCASDEPIHCMANLNSRLITH